MIGGHRIFGLLFSSLIIFDAYMFIVLSKRLIFHILYYDEVKVINSCSCPMNLA